LANTLGFVDELHKPAGFTEKRHQQCLEPTELNRLLGPPPYPPPRIPAPGPDTADHLLRHCPYFGAMFGRNRSGKGGWLLESSEHPAGAMSTRAKHDSLGSRLLRDALAADTRTANSTCIRRDRCASGRRPTGAAARSSLRSSA
jgi:hypothetical protein